MANIHITDWYEEEERLLEDISSGPPFPLLDHRLLLLKWELYKEIYPWDKENRPALPPPPMSLNIHVTTSITHSTSEPGLLLNNDGDELPLLNNLSDEALADSWRSARWGDDKDETASPYDVFIATPLTFLMECNGHHLYIHHMGTGDFATFHAFIFTWDNQKVTWHLYSEDSPHRVFSQWVALLYPPPIPGMHDWHPTLNWMRVISVRFAGKEEGVEQYEVELFRMFSDQVCYGDAKTPREFTPVVFQSLIAMIEWPGWLTDGVEALKAPTEFHPQPQKDFDDGWEVVPHTTIPVYDHVGVRGGC
ncbi:uncharacterized protein LAESUDRAFT_757544 [Laetiporus sulphureus 93-53]|uniref:Uncharacterized protein n=1 Tax=Laetiporus sulphureus 93-53 TaxID=1314785 RepID=A0A165F3D3_9APHY|nr:uncharacterized protein LAESUDRAFT_757544 [Laetiporus sulphureus 93-53]KZT08294.1 hypothetical protein LAESUDRAFT_757544 [Laetiporus sulphureus 93-53]